MFGVLMIDNIALNKKKNLQIFLKPHHFIHLFKAWQLLFCFYVIIFPCFHAVQGESVPAHASRCRSLTCFCFIFSRLPGGFQPLLLEPLFKFHHNLRKLDLQEEEYALIQAISLFSPGSSRTSARINH